jgi:esterase/lipase
VPKDWSIRNILLDGHGAGVKDFASTSMSKWKEQVNAILDDFCENHDNIVICAHSMGTLFAIREAIARPHKIKALFLLASPLKIFMKPAAVKQSLKIAFNTVDENNEREKAGKEAYGIQPDKNLLNYLGWIPRYIELFKESASVRKTIKALTCPTRFYQSKNDELVAKSSERFLKGIKNVKLSVLQKSSHFYYQPDDLDYLKSEFLSLIKSI